MDGHGAINDTARALFSPLGGDYDRWAAILSFGQDPRWRRHLIRHVPVTPGARVLDVATGTGAIARGLVRRYGCSVVGVDQSPQMLDGARERIAAAGLADRIELRLGSAEGMTAEEGSFDALTAGYLLRYLDDPQATIGRLLRLIRPGAPFAVLDFGVPPNIVARRAWHLYTGVGLPVLGRLISPGWAEVGRYLRPSIRAFAAEYPPERLQQLLEDAGGAQVHVQRLSLGGGLVAWGVRAVR
ncbi:MAG: demethylmenaquinone methyltransferase / 2-methoxy-6-polyprenyl,4-benzoquinol methylase [Gaiellales bacterium]|jgi:demethylmenaquinone methyltransferase/2-methoxy-6-polyprenyl-1,4-benzoquinol methylase|nr:demethylmenaquinone methyltransferase / 2-methoxy-6-polyprenyl,4-benzoquinol methylase [Gaiellales bacterium]